MKKTSLANKEVFYIENFSRKKSSPGWLQLVFHFGTENRAEQLKNSPCTYKVEYLGGGGVQLKLNYSGQAMVVVEYF